MKLLKMLRELLIEERRTVIAQVRLNHNSTICAKLFELGLGSQSFMRVEVRLQFDVDESGCMINENASSSVFVLAAFLSVGGQQSALGVREEVVYRDFLSWKQLVGLQRVGLLHNSLLRGAGHCLTTLFRVLTCSAQRSTCEFSCG